MIRSSSFKLAAPLLLLATPSLLAGCAAGRSFSIAMANPGSYQTVLVVGDAGAEPTSPAALSAGAPSNRPGAFTSLLASQAAAIRNQPTSTPTHLASAGVSGVKEVVSGALAQAGTPAVVAIHAATVPAVATTTAIASTAGAEVSVTSPIATAQASAGPAMGVSAGVATSAANAQLTVSPTTGAKVAVTTPVATAQITASPAQGVALAAAAPAAAVSVGAKTGSIAVQATTPAAIVQADLTTSASGGVHVSVPLVTAGASVAPSTGVQVAAASPATAALASTSRAALSATLSGVGSAAALAVPTPGGHAGVVQTLVTAVSKKPRHG